MGRGKIYSVVFVIIITLFWGFVLSFAATSLRERQKFNETVNMRTNILVATGLIDRDDAFAPEEIDELYNTSIESFLVDREGRVLTDESAEGVDLEVELESPNAEQWRLPVFVVTKNGQADVYAIPVFGRGLWSTLYGYLALERDFSTVRGITFYDHAETAGLGAEISEPWFQENFVGKQVFDGAGNLRSIGVVKGIVTDTISNTVEHDFYVDGISGASQTGRGVTNLLEDKLQLYEPYIRKIRAEN